jgi:hypothetical protein
VRESTVMALMTLKEDGMRGRFQSYRMGRGLLVALAAAVIGLVGAGAAVAPAQAASLPDLTVGIRTLRLSTNDDTVLRSFDLTARNGGTAPASGARVTLRVPRSLRYQGYRAPAGVTCSYYNLPDSTVPAFVTCGGVAVAAGGTATVTVTFTQPPFTSPTQVTVSATVDPANTIVESNEANNTASLTFSLF